MINLSFLPAPSRTVDGKGERRPQNQGKQSSIETSGFTTGENHCQVQKVSLAS